MEGRVLREGTPGGRGNEDCLERLKSFYQAWTESGKVRRRVWTRPKAVVL